MLQYTRKGASIHGSVHMAPLNMTATKRLLAGSEAGAAMRWLDVGDTHLQLF